MTAPLVSIVVPTKNRLALLRETIASVQCQTWDAWELIIVDDGSTDGTVEEAARLSETDGRIRLVIRKGPKSGGSVCRNLGLRDATGEYVIFLDSDDLLAPWCVERRVSFLGRHPHLGFAVFEAETFETHTGDTGMLFNIDTGMEDIDRFLACDFPWGTLSPIWRRDAIVRLGAWDESLPSWQDWELHLRAVLKRVRFARGGEVDCYVRVAPQNDKTSSKQMRDPEHLGAAVRLFAGVNRLLEETGQMTRPRRDAVTGLCFWVVRRWLNQQNPAGALRAWREARRKGALGGMRYWVGLAMLVVMRYRFLRWFAWQWVFPAFESLPGMCKKSKTFLSVPVPLEPIGSRG